MNQPLLFLIMGTALGLSLLSLLLLSAAILRYRNQQGSYLDSISGLKNHFNRQLISTEVAAQEAVFRSIAREIHDSIGLSLITVKLHLARLLPFSDPEQESTVNGSVSLLSTAMDQLRDIARGMNSDILEDRGLVNALQSEAAKINQLDLPHVELQIDGEERSIDSAKELLLLRIVQECLQNILKHSRATKVLIRLSYTDPGIYLSIDDNGIGMSVNAEGLRQGSGIINIGKRTKLMGGQLLILPGKPSGTSFRISIPINSNTHE
ncbi:hypothetical protein HHL16_17450 [Pseudoflavitalea sp. G-6-1-2]|uniref:sensor histidine kinase n=1 Tax=Pseudoflavitalea sp. G-6-1-2 TaxID=2728841 RepID=UPI00146C0ABD|nr:ATP-binding protein [Pseudoflavitalea sp. G-6-1-2]NML22673.1 hypothetical protein [Pseudoflavitalea sp. G-6-1-2]